MLDGEYAAIKAQPQLNASLQGLLAAYQQPPDLAQEQDEGFLQQQLQKEEQQKERVSGEKARVDTLAVNIKHWRSRAREAHECFTCRRKLNSAEMVTFMQIQARQLSVLLSSGLDVHRSISPHY